MRSELPVSRADHDRSVGGGLAAEHVYEDLLAAGVELYEYEPTMFHAKVMTVDGTVAVVGSANLNLRSLRHDEEIDVVLFDPTVTATLDAQMDADLARSVRVESGVWHERSPVRHLPRRLAGLIDRWI